MATPQQLTDLRNDLGDVNEAFTNEELGRLFDRATEYGVTTFPDAHWVAMALGVLQLTTQAARFNDYVLTDNQERRSQVWSQFNTLLEELKAIPAVNRVIGTTAGDSGVPVFRKLTYNNTQTLAGEYTR